MEFHGAGVEKSVGKPVEKSNDGGDFGGGGFGVGGGGFGEGGEKLNRPDNYEPPVLDWV